MDIDSLALAYAFGRLLERPAAARTPGTLWAVADALAERGVLRPLLATMETRYAANVTIVVNLDKAAAKKYA